MFHSRRFIFYIQLICCFLFFETVSKAQNKSDNATILYGIFNNEKTLETRIIPIYNSDIKAITQDLPKGFQISDANNFSPSPEWYGSATLAADPGTGLFFYASKSIEQQQVWAISQNGKQTNLSQETRKLSGHSLTKMAMGPDGYVYALSTGMESHVEGEGKKTMLIRFKACKNPGCSKIENIGFISEKGGFRNSLIYSGDMAFSNTGDLFLFGSEIDTTINYYKGGHIFKIASKDLKLPSKAKSIQIEYMGQIAGMGVKTGIDSTIVTGVAFNRDGSFILSTIDKYSGSRIHFFHGKIQREVTYVKPLDLLYKIPDGFKVSDLASFALPSVNILASRNSTKEKSAAIPLADNWEKNVTITKFNY